MAARRQNLKRKSEDFIYEVNENDLSADDEEITEKSLCKIAKIDAQSVSTPQANSTPNLKNSNNSKLDKNSTNMSSTEDSPRNSDQNIKYSKEDPKKWEYDKKNGENPRVIELEDSDKEDCSIEIIEKSVPVVDLCETSFNSVSSQSVDETAPASLQTVDLTSASLQTVDVTLASDEDGEIHEKTLTDAPVNLDSLQVVDEVNESIETETVEEPEDNYITITFGNRELQTLYKNKFMDFLKTIPEFQATIGDLTIKIVPNSIVEQKSPKKKHKKKKVKKELFVLDTNPSVNDSNNVRYSSKFSIEEDKPQNDSPKKIPGQTCFNCGECHSLRDCLQPRDFEKIAAARQKFSSGKTKVARYHVEDGNSKYPHVKPGVISENLRKALGLKKNELPSYIYGMRVLGYPPGWLQEARIAHTNLRLFDINGEKVKGTKEKKKKILDPDKIIDYSGFNAPLDKGIYDDYRRYNVPQYSNNMSKETMIKHFEKIHEQQESESETSDMDLDNEEQQVENKQHKKVIQSDKPISSPSLNDLEQKKKELIDEINASNFNQPNSQSSGYGTASQISTDDSEASNAGVETTLIVVKNSELGTPILKSSSCYSRLPNADNFTVGVSPVIDFENLPNSTGKYEQMTEVLNKVRTTLKSLDSSKQ